MFNGRSYIDDFFVDLSRIMMNDCDPPNHPGFLHVAVQSPVNQITDFRVSSFPTITRPMAWYPFLWPTITADCVEFSIPLNRPERSGQFGRDGTANNRPELQAGPSGLGCSGPSSFRSSNRPGQPGPSSNCPEYTNECPDEDVPEQNVVVIDDSDDDVILVSSGTLAELDVHRTLNGDVVTRSVATETPLRRNPSRKARNSKFGHDDNIYEKDFDLLDSSEGESVSECESPKSSISEERPQNLSVKNFKPWPVEGLHERPEYNSVENKIEKFDFTIRDIQNNSKKSKVEELKKPKPAKKLVAKKYVARKRNPKRKRSTTDDESVNVRVSIQECKAIVDENYDLLQVFLRNVNAAREMGVHVCLERENNPSEDVGYHERVCAEKYEDLVRNQCRLFSLINGVPVSEAMENLSSILN